ncbi:SIR2 family protein [Streptomyces sp. NPDC001513]|uniref:P-loop NTPase n=1 Tax=Streptomyces sp. NPDC001513 TaxID=3364580 RepID=UPI003698A569
MNTIGIKAGEEKALIYRLRSLLTERSRPVAFIVGSGISAGAVDGVRAIVASMRTMIGDPGEIALFDGRVTGPSDAEKYQQAADFALEFRDQDWLNLVIRQAVLGACPDLTPEERNRLARADEKELEAFERTSPKWRLNPATEGLGRLLQLLPRERRGPVITTNFDPLLEIAVRRAGARASWQQIDLDGKLSRGEDEDAVDIAHVHGYWRRGDTLHTVHQLQKPRPQLHGSLRGSLSGHAVVVVGYSGWDDAFSRSLREFAREQDMQRTDLIWCSYDPLTDESFSSGLLAELLGAPRRSFYHGIDANRLFPGLVDSYVAAVECPHGWRRIDRPLLDDLGTRTPGAAEAVAFFDGAQPDWPEALDPRIPRLSLVGELTEAVGRCLDGAGGSGGAGGDGRIVAAVGPMGEGKSMALRQATVDLARTRDDVTVLWRERGTSVDPEAVLAIPQRAGQHILLVSDDGAHVIDDLKRLMPLAKAQGRTDIHVLLAAQEWEWRNRRPWQDLGGFLADTVKVHGLLEQDGEDIVTAWRDCGALRELAKTPERERARKLVDLSQATFGRQESSLVGAMLALRYGPLLGEHVEELLRRIERHPMLREAFLMISVLHAAFHDKDRRIRPLSLRILAQALEMKQTDIEMRVEDTLRKEAGLSDHGENLWVRHVSIAEAALRISRAQRPDELVPLIRKVVGAAVRLSPAMSTPDHDLYSAAYLSARLEIAEESVAAAETAVAVAPARLSYRTSLVAALRIAKRLQEAGEAAERAAKEMPSMTDPESKFGFLLEWATVAGQDHRPESNALLIGAALALPLEEHQRVYALVNMGVPLRNLHEQSADPVYLEALRGVVGLLQARQASRQQKAYLRRHATYLTQCGAIPLAGEDDAWDALQTALDKLRPNAHPTLVPHLKSAGASVRPPKGAPDLSM